MLSLVSENECQAVNTCVCVCVSPQVYFHLEVESEETS